MKQVALHPEVLKALAENFELFLVFTTLSEGYDDDEIDLDWQKSKDLVNLEVAKSILQRNREKYEGLRDRLEPRPSGRVDKAEPKEV